MNFEDDQGSFRFEGYDCHIRYSFIEKGMFDWDDWRKDSCFIPQSVSCIFVYQSFSILSQFSHSSDFTFAVWCSVNSPILLYIYVQQDNQDIDWWRILRLNWDSYCGFCGKGDVVWLFLSWRRYCSIFWTSRLHPSLCIVYVNCRRSARCWVLVKDKEGRLLNN